MVNSKNKRICKMNGHVWQQIGRPIGRGEQTVVLYRCERCNITKEIKVQEAKPWQNTS